VSIRPRRPAGLVVAFGLAVVLAFAADLSAQSKRPIKHSDYEVFNSASGFKLSPDGKTFVHVLTPAEGDGAVIVRNLATGAEVKIPSGGKAVAQAPAPAEGAGPPAAPSFGNVSSNFQFTPDSKKLLFTLVPAKSTVDAAKAEKKKSDELPKPVLAIYDVASGKVSSQIEKVKSFTVYGEGAGILVYHKEAKPEELPKGPTPMTGAVVGGTAPPMTTPKGPMTGGQPPTGTGPRTSPGGAGGTAPAPRPVVAGSDLVVRNLATGIENTIADVADFTVTKDYKTLVYTVQTKAGATNGVYATTLQSTGPGTAVKAGTGKASRLTWDDKQTKLAFFYTEIPTPPTATTSGSGSSGTTTTVPLARAKVSVYVWERPNATDVAAVSTAAQPSAAKMPSAFEAISASPEGLKVGWAVVDRGGLNFSADSSKLVVATAPVPATPITEPVVAGDDEDQQPGGGRGQGRSGTTAPRLVEDKALVDIWHWKDEAIQPMQQVRSATDKLKTYKAIYFLDTKKFRHLDDEDTSITVPDAGDIGLMSTDKRYRAQTWVSFNPPRDYATVNLRTGEADKRLLFTALRSAPFRSPKGGYIVTFNGTDWTSTTMPGAKHVNLTAKLPVKFFNEEDDHPDQKPPYAAATFTSDDKSVLLQDKFDLWKVALDGSGAENLTKIGRETKTEFRLNRFADPDAPEERGLDLSKTYLLSAENQETYDTGFYRLEPGQKPKLLIMGSRRYSAPVKARKSETYVLTISTYYDYPDYYVADKDFKEVKRITDINPKVREFNWGKAELVHYKSADGVPLKGMLIKPEDFDPSKKYPMIVYIYERLSQGVHQFRMPNAGTSINPTYYASNGYLVFMPDIAYTIGSPGQSALKCVLPAIQAVADKGYVNEAAIGIQGHSWGAYQVCYLITQTNRFKAVAAGAPVSNMTSAYGGIRWSSGLPRQAQYEHTQSRIGANLWEAPMRYIENSPLFMADRVQTPLLMLHNDKDGAVPWYQGIEYYLALRRLNKEVYMLNYNGEDHGLAKKANMRDYTMRMQQFFDYHLKAAPMPEWMAKGVSYNDREKEKDQWKKLFEPEKK